ncbi:unnamed protein product [Oikopleura dioica]|uniref:Origin recognition complex subunit 4 n=1 Tax=Oikopleura dioica TaxID=34765 RepID=E4X3F4_OIKDI|nr:unnamed protein product [Oikopleura dioica]
MSEFQKDLLKRIISINQFSTVRPSIKETCDNLCSIICSRIKRKESGNILLIGSPGSGKSFIIKKAIETASEQVGEIKETYISGLTDIKNISSALDFEFDPNQPEVIILEELTILAGQERWLYGLLEEARKASKLVVATSLKIDALEALEKRIRSRFASAVHLIPPASDKELVEIAKDDLLSVLPSEEKYRELWIESVEDGFMGLYDHLVDFAKVTTSIADFKSLFIPAIAALDPQQPELSAEIILSQIESRRNKDLLFGCSVFEMIILLCYASLIKKDTVKIHLIAVYQEYLVWKRQHNQKKYEIPRTEVKKCFERLLQLSIIEYVKNEKATQKVYQPTRLRFTLADLNQAIISSPILPAEIRDQAGTLMAG